MVREKEDESREISGDLLASVSRLTDDQWLSALKQSIDDRHSAGVVLPGFPPADLQSRIVGSSGRAALDEAFRFYRLLKASCAAYGHRLRADSKILDFGVGWGRIIRFFLKDVDAAGLYGVDTDRGLVEICRRTSAVAHVDLVESRGSLPYPDKMFELVFAYSVFTHLPEEVHFRWLDEIRRVLKPGGLFVATVEPPRFLQHFLNLPVHQAQNNWEKFLSQTVKARPELFTELSAKGFAFIKYATHPDYGDCVIAPSFVYRRWTKYFQVIEYRDEASKFFQAVVTGKRRPE